VSLSPFAAALAKAQSELVNLEKNLVATIRSGGPKGDAALAKPARFYR
jgi:hypothetical protein